MKTNRRSFVLGCAAVCLLFLSARSASAQQPSPRGYLFVEVKDATGKVVDDATVTFSGMGDSVKTNQEGVAQASFQPRFGQQYELQVSKPGYLTSEHVLFHAGGNLRDRVFFGEDIFNGKGASVDDKPPPIRVTLYRVPTTPAERAAVEAVGQRRRLLMALKRRNVAELRQLLGAGARADTTDSSGVPAIAWAAFIGEAEAIKLLLDAGAKPGLVDKRGRTALAIAKEMLDKGSGHPTVVGLLEEAARRR
jgi:hypothetical protein